MRRKYNYKLIIAILVILIAILFYKNKSKLAPVINSLPEDFSKFFTGVDPNLIKPQVNKYGNLVTTNNSYVPNRSSQNNDYRYKPILTPLV